MQSLLNDYYAGRLTRRGFLGGLMATGLSVSAATSIVEAAEMGTAEGAAADEGKTLTGTGGDLVVEQMRAAGSRFVFTNPGSMEVGFFDALTDRDDIKVIVGMHESIVIPMADGYHRATLQPAFVNVHTVGGTAQMAGQLYNAHYDGSALIVTSGLVDTGSYSDEGLLAPSPGFGQAEINRMFTKISWEVRNPAVAALALRRAYKVATTAPGGPVYVAYSRESLAAKNVSGAVYPRANFMVDARPRPAADQIQSLAKMLVESQRPVPIFGDEVWKSGAQKEVLELVELLGLPAAGPGLGQGYRNVPTRHPQYVGTYGTTGEYPRANADLVIQVGTRDWGGTAPPATPRLAAGAKFVALGMDTDKLGRTQPMDLAIVADVKAALRDLIDAVKSTATADRIAKIRDARLPLVRGMVERRHKAILDSVAANTGKTPIHPEELSMALDRELDADAILVFENQSAPGNQTDPGTTIFNCGFRENEKMWLTNTGLSLGWGLGAAIGTKLGQPNRQVVCSIGDGATMFSAAAFWSMKRYQVPVLTVISNNLNYQAVRNGFFAFEGRMKATGHYHGMYLGDPEIDFVKLAESQGVKGERVTSGSQLSAALKRGIQATRDGNPYVLEVMISRVGGGADSTWHQGYKLAPERTRNV